MSKRAEQRGLEALPPRWRKTKDGKGKVDSALPVRKFYIRAYEQAEKDLALTAEDVGCIYNLVLQMKNKYNATSACYQEVADIFNKDREEENESKSN